MEKVKGIFKHYFYSEVLILLCIFFYIIINMTNESIFNNKGGFLIILFPIISLINLFYSILFYFINIYVPKIESIILMLLILIFTVIYYYTKTGPNLNVVYEHPVDTFNRETDKLIKCFLMGLIIIHLSLKFIPSIGFRKK